LNHIDDIKKAVMEEIDAHREHIDGATWFQIRIGLSSEGEPINTIWQQEDKRDLRIIRSGSRTIRLTGK
jgi:hypothetical protein